MAQDTSVLDSLLRYTRSTTLYSTFTSWAAVMGRARPMMLRGMLPREKSFCGAVKLESPPV